MSHFSTSAGLYQTDVDYSNTRLVRKSDNHCAFTILQAYLNQKRLDAEAKRLHTNAQEFAKQVCHSRYLGFSYPSSKLRCWAVTTWLCCPLITWQFQKIIIYVTTVNIVYCDPSRGVEVLFTWRKYFMTLFLTQEWQPSAFFQLRTNIYKFGPLITSLDQ